MTLNGFRRQRDQYTEGGKCSDLHALLLEWADTHSVTLDMARRISAARTVTRGCTRKVTMTFHLNQRRTYWRNWSPLSRRQSRSIKDKRLMGNLPSLT